MSCLFIHLQLALQIASQLLLTDQSVLVSVQLAEVFTEFLDALLGEIVKAKVVSHEIYEVFASLEIFQLFNHLSMIRVVFFKRTRSHVSFLHYASKFSPQHIVQMQQRAQDLLQRVLESGPLGMVFEVVAMNFLQNEEIFRL